MPSFTPISPWADRFNPPTVDRLAASLEGESSTVFRQTRRMLHEVGLVHESVLWRGECWKWTIEFRTAASEGVFAILIPSPENVQLAVPMTREFVASLPIRRLKKAVREGLDLASEPFDTNLAIWSIATPGLVADLRDLLMRRVRPRTRKTG